MNKSQENSDSLFETLVIVGVGLIGGSIARAAKTRQVVQHVIGVGRDAQRLQAAVDAGVLDQATTEVSEAVKAADLVVVCTPVDCIAADVLKIYPHLPDHTLITDAGSTKGKICQQITTTLGPNHRFVGSHPLAGSEKTGFEHASADLFERAVVILTPDAGVISSAVARVRTFWQQLGAVLEEMAPEDHDQSLAMTSHLPHLVASALAAAVTEKDLPFAATGYGDTTRIAAGDPQLWTSIFMENAPATLQAAKEFQRRLETMIAALKDQQPERLTSLLQVGKRHRDLWKQENQ